MKATRKGMVRWVVLGTVIGVTAAWGGFGLASSAPSAITTCTKVSNGKQAIIPASGAAKCTKKGKGTVALYDAHSTNVALTNQLTAAQQLAALLRAEKIGYGAFDFHGLDLSDMRLIGHVFIGTAPFDWNLRGADFSGSDLAQIGAVNADFSGADFSGITANGSFWTSSNFSGANFTNAHLYYNEGVANFTDNTWGPTPPIFNNTICPDASNSDTNPGNTCIGFGMS